MNKIIAAITAMLVLTITASSQAPEGKWVDTSKDKSDSYFVYTNGAKTVDVLLMEDYEVTQTHEVCASIYGYFMKKSERGRYDVNFKGMRTQATFTFTTRDAAEQWVQKFCTAQSLTQIKGGKGELARKY